MIQAKIDNGFGELNPHTLDVVLRYAKHHIQGVINNTKNFPLLENCLKVLSKVDFTDVEVEFVDEPIGVFEVWENIVQDTNFIKTIDTTLINKVATYYNSDIAKYRETGKVKVEIYCPMYMISAITETNSDADDELNQPRIIARGSCKVSNV